MDTHQPACGRASRLWNAEAGSNPSLNAACLGRRHSSLGKTIDIGQLMQNSTNVAQKYSAFFTRLPLEMRCKIYSFVLPLHRRLWVRPALSSHAVNEDSQAVPHRVLNHFPCKTPPSDTTWTYPNGSACCLQTSPGFFTYVEIYGVQPDADSLALMQTCQQMYLETCRLWTFCFDNIETLSAFTGIACILPATEKYSSRWSRKLNAAWERELRRVDALCKKVPELGTLLLSVHKQPRFVWLENEEAVIESLKAITAAPKLKIELL
ncbi:hypothetical protein MMYC01_207766 [Madurella mycetomatis]|uniref:DUF7730 domain-containing protein n=1 Tax=Madurella mycetomatis TaxID=100816 RepID=A0A175VU50_9PEZI|nr:hypothetical protein MMYC01_207766 [Madurella mycetomatis]